MLAFPLNIDTKLWMQNVPNTLMLHIQEHIAKITFFKKITLYLTAYHFIISHNQPINIINIFWFIPSSLLSVY